ncbi:uncharacterized protein KY384_007048 [Bacidia gigantensis]|uniref:uncharacterized protein n=1 Tax=Bacidia gigantensis TaxID=2732470 RepID=UPI001D055B4B|nr:uncharacterized protein KY384_007048 [Bacidia gigantensis]KAG8528132.1 hypothetical protein KY384_007048 [Bacidia gigantensis]
MSNYDKPPAYPPPAHTDSPYDPNSQGGAAQGYYGAPSDQGGYYGGQPQPQYGQPQGYPQQQGYPPQQGMYYQQQGQPYGDGAEGDS